MGLIPHLLAHCCVLPQLAEEKPVAPVSEFNSFQIQVSGKNVNFYNFAMAHLRSIAGVNSAAPQQINPGGTSYILVQYKGAVGQLAAALAGRGWLVETGPTQTTHGQQAGRTVLHHRNEKEKRRCVS